MRSLISRLIAEDAALEVIGVARNGMEAIRKVRELKPDVVTMDIEMPEMNGLDALMKIMEQRPTPIIMLSSLTQKGSSATITALQNGAVDFISKPSGSDSFDLFKVKNDLISKIKQAAQIPLKNLIRSNITIPKVDLARKGKPQTGLPQIGTTRGFDQILALGTSTGGPKALETVITALPASFSYPLLVVQHMPPKFTKSLADRLNRLSEVQVVEAEDNQLVLGGTVYIAPGDYHMTTVQKNKEIRIKLHQGPEVSGHRPSVDVLFDSISQLKNHKRHFIIMTGMGSDGAKGMLSAKEAGAQSTIVESQESCIVYGMPKSAIALGCVDYTIPLHLITSKILKVTGALKS
ncbi:chemotaxis response regulator protein-glutamate methylesterase [Paenibacillus crassostreae]|uniref:Protein-glutamate methylesterase/protein-glutamine glutaminase n=2 Tax=Paenibacillus crassostreae TaxID=1763538 RepID=A0A167BI96_9BACL|nr:chemotaxis response regulator protein-glutamate methylesterase [Paenibacillus crassostreae]OAB72091.1 chemotaxis response regulator protein-glutamate methylesterase [Paenibacillus crassostreae]